MNDLVKRSKFFDEVGELGDWIEKEADRIEEQETIEQLQKDKKFWKTMYDSLTVEKSYWKGKCVEPCWNCGSKPSSKPPERVLMPLGEAWEFIESDLLDDHDETPEYLAQKQQALDTINGDV